MNSELLNVLPTNSNIFSIFELEIISNRLFVKLCLVTKYHSVFLFFHSSENVALGAIFKLIKTIDISDFG